MKMLLVTILSFFVSLAYADEHFQGFVELEKGREIYVDWKKADPGYPTVILLNGLTYKTTEWKKMTKELVERKVGVLRFDFYGMGQTLLKYAPILNVIPVEEQIRDTKALLSKLKIPKPYNLVGLSYGGGVAIGFAAKFPSEINQLILFAPFTEPLKATDDWIKSQIWYTRQVQPWNPATDDELYDFFLKQAVYTTYPSAEPIVLENPFKLEATFRLVQGIRKFRAESVVKQLPTGRVHLVVAGLDQYVPREMMETFWKQVPQKAKASFLLVNNTEHKMPESVPSFSAAWVVEVLNQNTLIKKGRHFEADPHRGVVKYQGGQFEVGVE